MAYMLKINGVEKTLADGFIITEISSDELNQATLKIIHSPKLDLHEKDRIEIIDSTTIEDTEVETFHYYFYLGNYVEERITNNTVEEFCDFNYTMSLISSTIVLEDYPLPNRTITQKPTTGENSVQKNSIYYYMKAYIDEYAPTLTISNELKVKTQNTPALEDQFPNLNLREIFNKLLEPIGCVVSMKNYTEISYMDLNAKGQEIDRSKLVIDNRKATFEEYASHIKIIAENCTSETINVSEENVAVKANDNIVTDDNMIIPTEHTIYQIGKVYVYAKVNATIGIDIHPQDGISTHVEDTYSSRLMKLDITPFICEKTIYDSKIITNTTFSFINWLDDNNEFDLDKCLKYKITNLSFTNGNPNIEGLSYNEKRFLNDFYACEKLIQAALLNYNFTFRKNVSPTTTYSYTSYVFQLLTDPRDLIFDIDYSSRQTLNLEFEKENAYRNKRTIIDSQRSSYIDNDRLGVSIQEKINRAGNPTRAIAGRYKSFLLIPNLDDTIGDYKLVQRTLTFYKNEILFSGMMYKDFNRKNLVTSINQQVRYTTIDTTNNSVMRMENTRIVFTLSNSFNSSADRNMFKLINYMINNLGKTSSDVVYTYKTTDSANIEYGIFRMFPSVQKINKCVVISFKMNDNYSAGYQIKDTSQTGGYGLATIPYCDEYGEFVKAKFAIYTGHNVNPLTNQAKAVEESRSFPKFPATSFSGLTNVYELENLRYKDNREIIGETYQLDFRSDNNIFIKDLFVNYIPFLLKETKFNAFKVFISTTETYAKNDNQVKGEYKFDSTSCTISNGRITMPESYFTNATCWAITDDANKLLIACNGNSNILAFNFK